MSKIQELYEAVSALDIEKVKKLLDEGVDVDADIRRDYGEFRSETGHYYHGTPLFVVVDGQWLSHSPEDFKKSAEIACLLIDRGANVKYTHNENILTQAANRGMLSVVKKLLEKGADINRKDNLYPSTALHRAIDGIPCFSGCLEVAKYLLQQKECDVNATNRNNANPLFLAAMFGDGELAKMLIQKGAKVNNPGYYGETPLSRAVYFCNLPVVRVLLDAGAADDKNKLLSDLVYHRNECKREKVGAVALELIQRGATSINDSYLTRLLLENVNFNALSPARQYALIGLLACSEGYYGTTPEEKYKQLIKNSSGCPPTNQVLELMNESKSMPFSFFKTSSNDAGKSAVKEQEHGAASPRLS